MKRAIKYNSWISLFTFVLIAATLSGWNIKQKLQAQFADPVAEDYLVKMLDAVEKDDVDAAENFFRVLM